MTESEEKSSNRKKPIQVYYNIGLYDKITQYSEEHGFPTYSQFIREAVKEKIRRLEHPEQFQSDPGVKGKLDDVALEKMMMYMEKSLRLQEEIKRDNDLLIQKLEIMKSIDALSKDEDLSTIKREIKKLFIAYGENKILTIQEILDMTDLPQRKVFKAISDLDMFKPKGRGFILND